jgi:hypothetical protein
LKKGEEDRIKRKKKRNEVQDEERRKLSLSYKRRHLSDSWKVTWKRFLLDDNSDSAVDCGCIINPPDKKSKKPGHSKQAPISSRKSAEKCVERRNHFPGEKAVVNFTGSGKAR